MIDPGVRRFIRQRAEGGISQCVQKVAAQRDCTKGASISQDMSGGGCVCSRINMFKQFTEDDRGIAYGIGVLIVFLILSSLFYIAYTVFISGLIDVFNSSMIPTGDVSVDRGGSMMYLYRMWAAVPFFILIAGALWGIVRALEMKRSVG